MKFLIVGDLHGHMPTFHFKEFDAIIAPGDFCSDAPRRYMFDAIRLAQLGFEIEWYDLVGRKKARDMIQKSVRDGRKILEKLNSFGVPVYLTPGNWDWTGGGNDWAYLRKGFYHKLTKGLHNIIDLHLQIVEIPSCIFIGHGITSGPERPSTRALNRLTKRERKQALSYYMPAMRRLDHLFRSTQKSKKPIIFLSHNMPKDTILDKITDKKSPAYGHHYGSVIARDIVLKQKPLLCIGGHMHEHFGKCRLGKTTCINAGFGSNVNVLLEIDGKRKPKLTFWSKKEKRVVRRILKKK